MRRIIAAMQMSVDGFIEGPSGEVDWIESWEDPFDLLPQIDTCILGRRMFAGYEHYWRAILANPDGVLALTGKTPSANEVAYARFADRATHVVLATTPVQTSWANTRVVTSVDAIRALKDQPGKDMHAVGGATLVSSLMNAGLVDELRVVVRPIVLGGGTAMFKDVASRHALRLGEARPLAGGAVRLTYAVVN
jgi:dihydrofolate reductase